MHTPKRSIVTLHRRLSTALRCALAPKLAAAFMVAAILAVGFHPSTLLAAGPPAAGAIEKEGPRGARPPILETLVPPGEEGAAARGALQRARRAPSPEQIVAGAWWNRDDLGGKLDLSAEQRGRLDTLLGDFLGGRAERARRQREARERYFQALEAADLEGARQASEALAAATADTLHAQYLLRVELAAALTVPQLLRLQSENPRIWRRALPGQDAPRPAARPGIPQRRPGSHP